MNQVSKIRGLSLILLGLAVWVIVAQACSPPEPQVSLVSEPIATVAAPAASPCVTKPEPTPRSLTDGLDVYGPPPTPRPTQSMLRDVMPGLAAMPGASELRIQRGWVGMSLPRMATYLLKRVDGAFKGEARFEVGMGMPGSRDETHPVIIPVALTEGVLRDLSLIQVSPGPYTPWIQHTDDFPTKTVVVMFGGQEARFVTHSQGEGNVPWSVEYGDQTVVAESPDIAMAIKRLETCLLLDTYEGVIHDAVDEFHRIVR
jgi:hypothetical protein